MIEAIRNIDFLLSFIYLTVFIVIISALSKKIKNKEIRAYFFWGGVLKLISSQLYCFLYVYYYTFGDTIRFFRLGQMYKGLLTEIENLSFIEWLYMSNSSFKDYISYQIDYSYGFADSSFVINKISALFSFFTFNSFLVNTALFSLLSFAGIWSMYKVFIRLYPALYKEFAFAIVFFPSVLFWGSGLMKDTLSIGSIGFMTMCFCKVFILKEKLPVYKTFLYVILFSICSYLVLMVKTYQLLAYLSGAFVWLFYNYRDRIKNNFIRVTITPFLLASVAVVVILGLQVFSEQLNEYALENVVDTALALSYNLSKIDAGSAYDLGPMDPSLAGLLSKFPASVNVTLFRPYLFEVNNVVMLIAAFESLAVTLITGIIIYRVGLFTFIKSSFGNGILLFCFVFSFIFSFAVGISSSNFGSLVRYKIPLLPFYMSGLFILYYQVKNQPFFADLRKKKIN